MTPLTSLWLPILVATLGVFLWNTVAWTRLPHHRDDFKVPPDGVDPEKLLDTNGLAAGQYVLESPQRGDRPRAVLVVAAGPTPMGRNLLFSALLYGLVSVLVAYVTAVGMPAGAPAMKVLQLSGTAGVMAYSLGLLPNAIWFGRPVRPVVMDVLDGVVAGLLTGVIFALLWPAA